MVADPKHVAVYPKPHDVFRLVLGRVVPFYISFSRGGFPYYNRLLKKNGTLILTSPLEDPALGEPPRF